MLGNKVAAKKLLKMASKHLVSFHIPRNMIGANLTFHVFADRQQSSSDSTPTTLLLNNQSPTPPPPPTVSNGARNALKFMEETLSNERVWLFNRRFLEGYDVKTDEVYNTWKAIKEKSVSEDAVVIAPIPPAASPSTSSNPSTSGTPTTSANSTVSPHTAKHLTFPKAAPTTTQKKRRSGALPKAITGQAYIAMIEKQKEKDEEKEKKNRKERQKELKKKRIQQHQVKSRRKHRCFFTC